MLTGDLMDSIRALIGVDETTVPNDTIIDPLIGGAVEQLVADRVGDPPYENRPEHERFRMRQAVAYLVAARLLGTSALRERASTQSERFSDQYQIQRNLAALDLDGWRADLERQAEEALAPLIRARTSSIFTVAGGRRGQ